MLTLITIFYISLAALMIMLLLKRQEVRTGRASIVSRVGSGTDHLFQALFARVRKGFSYLNKHTFYVIMQWLAYHALLRVRKIYVEMKHRALENPQGKKLIDAVRGRGEVKDHGASFYLRRISADHSGK